MRILIVIFAAIAAGLGLGYARSHVEFNNVEEKFSVFKEVFGNENNAGPGEVEVAGAEVPQAVLQGSVTHNFGSMDKGEKKEHTFWFKNEGTGILEVTLVKTSCKCTIGELKGKTKRVPPGQKIPVKLEWKSENYEKRFRQSATIETNDPARRNITLFVEGVVFQPIRPEPANVVFSGAKSGKESSSRVRLYSYKRTDLSIDGTEFLDKDSQRFFDVKFRPLTAEELAEEINALSGVMVEVFTKKGLPIGPLRQTLKLNTNIEPIEIPITGRVTGDFTFNLVNLPGQEYQFDEEQNQLRFGSLESGQDASVELVLNTNYRGDQSDIDISIEPNEIIPSAKHIKIDVLRDKFKKIGRLHQFRIRITIPKDCPEINLLGPDEKDMGRFVIRTTHPTAKLIEIYVRFAMAR